MRLIITIPFKYMIGFIITAYAGLEHAFEADHLLAVNSLVTNRNKLKESVKDGMLLGNWSHADHFRSSRFDDWF